jgi:hypothetical protein
MRPKNKGEEIPMKTSNITIPETQEEVNNGFERLGRALEGYGLPTKGEAGSPLRRAFEEEFMLMHQTIDPPEIFFKHRGTRCYLVLNEDGSLRIPALVDNNTGNYYQGFYGEEAGRR